jgi:signal transduction histidine kinase
MTPRDGWRGYRPGMGHPAAPFALRRGGAPVSAQVVDVVVAALLLAGGLGALATLSRGGSPAVATVSCVLMAGAVAVRRRAPLAAALTALAGLVGYVTHDPKAALPPVAVVLCFYTLGRSGSWRRHPARTVLAVAAALAACAGISIDLHSTAVEALSSWLGVAVVPLVVGVGVARRSALSVQLAATAAQLRAEQDLNATRASAGERNRVARDLHDVVAHCVSVMVVQAGGARLVAERDPAAADQALAVIGGCGRDALADLRRIVGVLRRDVDPDFGSGAGLADLPRLAERIRLAGVPTSTTIEGDAPLPPATDVVVYRVAQEALTNVVKHAGEGATADVHVNVSPDTVVVEITDTGGTAAAGHPRTSGHGLIGMRERVTAYDGELRCGPRPGGGYAVTARIPLRATDRRGPDSPRVFRRGQRLHHWPGWLGEAAIVIGWLVAMEAEVATSSARRLPLAVNAAAVAVMALATTWRRRNPMLFLIVVGALAAMLSGGLTSLDRSTVTGLYSLAVPLFTIAAWQPRTRAAVGFALWTAGTSTVAAVRHATIGGLSGALIMGLVVWTGGRIWRAQRTLNAELAETTASLATERDRQAELAVASERTRIARELHGLVAHGVVTMVVQAEAARNVLIQHPGNASDSIRAIEQNGRDALTQLRRILGVLRAPGRASDEPTTQAPFQSPVATQPRDETFTSLPEVVLT